MNKLTAQDIVFTAKVNGAIEVGYTTIGEVRFRYSIARAAKGGFFCEIKRADNEGRAIGDLIVKAGGVKGTTKPQAIADAKSALARHINETMGA